MVKRCQMSILSFWFPIKVNWERWILSSGIFPGLKTWKSAARQLLSCHPQRSTFIGFLESVLSTSTWNNNRATFSQLKLSVATTSSTVKVYSVNWIIALSTFGLQQVRGIFNNANFNCHINFNTESTFLVGQRLLRQQECKRRTKELGQILHCNLTLLCLSKTETLTDTLETDQK